NSRPPSESDSDSPRGVFLLVPVAEDSHPKLCRLPSEPVAAVRPALPRCSLRPTGCTCHVLQYAEPFFRAQLGFQTAVPIPPTRVSLVPLEVERQPKSFHITCSRSRPADSARP